MKKLNELSTNIINSGQKLKMLRAVDTTAIKVGDAGRVDIISIYY